MKKLSIVVPVYNVEKYLARCLDSLLQQTYKEIEIILVNDGSTDTSPQICDRYSDLDDRVIVIHKTNGGLSSARNAGLNAAKGDYLGFVDSDDDVEIDMFEKLVNIIEEQNVDFVMCDYIRILDNGSRYLKTTKLASGRYDKKRIIEEIFPNLIMGNDLNYGPLLSVWHCLYRTDFLRENNIRFDEEIKWSEDNIFSAEVGLNANSFYYQKGLALYHYYQNEGSISNSYRPGAWDIYRKMNDHLHLKFDGVKNYDFSRQLDLHLIYYACNCLQQASHLTPESGRSYIREILSNKDLKHALMLRPGPSVSLKLLIQLTLMKYQLADLMFYLISR